MTDLTSTFSSLLTSKGGTALPTTPKNLTSTPDEFLKEAYRINAHISSLLKYLHSIRASYLSITPSSSTTTSRPSHSHPYPPKQTQPLSDPARDSIDTSTTLLLHDLSTSISNLSSAESLRHETVSSALRTKYGRSKAGHLLFRWAGGKSPSTHGENGEEGDENDEGKSREQVLAEQREKTTRSVRENILWFLRRGVEDAIVVQRGMVEKRIERIREREKSVLYKSKNTNANANANSMSPGAASGPLSPGAEMEFPTGSSSYNSNSFPEMEMASPTKGTAMDEAEMRAIEAELTPQQLQLFEQENDAMVRYYEDQLGKVQNAEKSLLEISSLQQTLVSHLSTQEEYIDQLVTDAANTQSNIGEGNKELKRAAESRSAAQVVFWGTVGLCSGLVVWDLIF